MIILTALFSLAGCHSSTDLEANGMPRKLIIGMYGGDNKNQIKAAIEPFRLYLQKKLGIKVEYIFTTDYTSVINALRTKKIDMANLGPYEYVIAMQKPGFLPLVTIGENGKPSIYHSVIFTSHKTGIKTIADLKRNAKSLTLCFSDPASTSGHLIPRNYLKSIGLNPDNSFKGMFFAINHDASILNVKSGIADIGCSTNDLPQNRLIKNGVKGKDDLVILWTSPPIMNDVLTVRSDLNKDFIGKIRNAYLAVAKEDFPALAAYTRLYHTDPEKISYVTTQDSMYNPIRQKANNVEELKLEK